jgi:DNA-binding beta-propeller fold protein YncE
MPGYVRAQQTEALKLETQIPLAGVKGRIDHLSVDLASQRLFVAAVENHTLEVIDLKSGKRVHSIPDLAEPQGVFYEPSTNRLFVACSLDGTTKVFDGTAFKLLATAKFPDDADNIRYDEHNKTVIVGYAGAKQLRAREEGSGGLGLLDLNGNRVGDIVIDAHPESFQLEKTGSRVFVNVPDKKEIEVVDSAQRAVVARWPVASCEDNFPMALDEAQRRLFVACWKPPQLLVFNADTGKQVAAGNASGPSDDLFLDSALQRIYILTRSGFLDVFQQKDADHYLRIGRYPTPPHSQTGLFVPSWKKLFVAVPAQSGQSAQIRVYRTQE